MDIIYRDPENLKDYANNPRNNAEAIEPVMESIKEFGFLVPVLITEDDEIVAGHTRKAAAVRLGMSEIPCICKKGLQRSKSGRLGWWTIKRLSLRPGILKSWKRSLI